MKKNIKEIIKNFYLEEHGFDFGFLENMVLFINSKSTFLERYQVGLFIKEIVSLFISPTAAFFEGIALFLIHCFKILFYPIFVFIIFKENSFFRKFKKNILNEMLKYQTKIIKNKGFLTLFDSHEVPRSPLNNKDELKKFILNFLRKQLTTVDKNGRKEKYKRRSAGDIYLLISSFYPKDIDFKTLLLILFELVKEKKVLVSKCSDIKKFVFRSAGVFDHNTFYNKNEFVEYFDTKISMEELLKLLKK